MTRLVTNYRPSDHDAALAVAADVLGRDMDYNTRRANLQAVVRPLLAAEFSLADLDNVWGEAQAKNPHALGLSFKPNAANFTQRMNVKTLTWIIVQHAAGSVWPDVWGSAAANGLDSDSFANIQITDEQHANNVIAIKTMADGRGIATTTSTTTAATGEHSAMTNTTTTTTTNAAALPPLATLSVGQVVDLIDVLMAESGLTQAEAVAALGRLHPADGALIAAAENLVKLRGERTTPRPEVTGVMADIVAAASKPLAVPPVPEKLPELDATTASIIDGVLTKMGLPSINTVIAKANAAGAIGAAQAEVKRLGQEVEEWKRKASMVPAAAPVEVAASGEIPGGVVVMKNAADLFGVPASKRSLLDFNVPVGEWKDAHGVEVPHPAVPALMTDFIFNLSTLVPLLLSIVNNDKPWLRGHTGTGKTTVVEQVYARLKLPLYRVNLDSDISRSELVGAHQIRHDPTSGATVTKFEEGIIPRSMQEPCGLLLDEIDASRPDLAFVLQRLTEGKGFMLLEDGGRTIHANPWFRIFATANTNGRGDETGLYTGTRVLGSAFLNRFGPFLTVDYIDAKSEVKLVQMRAPTLDKALTEQIVGYAKEHRIAFTQGQVTLPCSPRDTVGLAQRMAAYLQIFPTKEEAIRLSFDHCIFNAADNDDVVILKGLADRFIKAAGTAAKAAPATPASAAA